MEQSSAVRSSSLPFRRLSLAFIHHQGTQILTIIVVVTPASSGRFDAHIDGRYILTSPSPLIDVARILIERGADPDTPIAMRHAGRDVDAVWGRLGSIAVVRVTSATDGRPILRRQAMAAPPLARLKRSCRPLLTRGRPND